MAAPRANPCCAATDAKPWPCPLMRPPLKALGAAPVLKALPPYAEVGLKGEMPPLSALAPKLFWELLKLLGTCVDWDW